MDLNEAAFIELFKATCKKCLGTPLTEPLSETDSKHISNTILEKTGLVIGAKSIKNYSFYVLDAENVKKENPSVATLDTFARYVLDAPYTDESTRKNNEGHFPFWFQYRSNFSNKEKTSTPISTRTVVLLFAVFIFIAVAIFYTISGSKNLTYSSTLKENFNDTSNDSLFVKGWEIKNMDDAWWAKRNATNGVLTLYTLPGDNLTDSSQHAIRNLLVRQIDGNCFSTEVHFTDFFPQHNWQQAGIILSEDSSFNHKTLRISLSYNDFFGGYEKAPEIIIQAISSAESGNASKPEEIAHLTIFSIDTINKELTQKNLSRSALKIEKKANHFRFLYTAGAMENFAFKEVVSRDFDFQPRYLGIFAIQGITKESNIMAVNVDSFSFIEITCPE